MSQHNFAIEMKDEREI